MSSALNDDLTDAIDLIQSEFAPAQRKPAGLVINNPETLPEPIRAKPVDTLYRIEHVSHAVTLHDTCIEHDVTIHFRISDAIPTASWSVSLPLVNKYGVVRSARADIRAPDGSVRRIVGAVKAASAARREYRQAVASGKRAFLAEQGAHTLVTWSVGNVDPGSQLEFHATVLSQSDARMAQVTIRGEDRFRAVYRVVMPSVTAAPSFFTNTANTDHVAAGATGATEMPVAGATVGTTAALSIRSALSGVVLGARCTQEGEVVESGSTDCDPSAGAGFGGRGGAGIPVLDSAPVPASGAPLVAFVVVDVPATSCVRAVMAPLPSATEDSPSNAFTTAASIRILDQGLARAAEAPGVVVLAIDLSGSMFWGQSPPRAFKAVRALVTLLQMLPTGSRVAVLFWGTQFSWLRVHEKKSGPSATSGGLDVSVGSGNNRPDNSFVTSPAAVQAIRAHLLPDEGDYRGPGSLRVRDHGGTEVGSAMRLATAILDRMMGEAGPEIAMPADADADAIVAAADADADPCAPASAEVHGFLSKARQATNNRATDAGAGRGASARAPLRPGVVMLLTDGQFSNPHLGDTAAGKRVVVVGVGSDVSEASLRALADQSVGGATSVIDDDASDVQVTLALSEVLRDALSPVTLRVEWPAGAKASVPEDRAVVLPATRPLEVFALLREPVRSLRVVAVPSGRTFEVPLVPLPAQDGPVRRQLPPAWERPPGWWLPPLAALGVARQLPDRAAVGARVGAMHKLLGTAIVGVEESKGGEGKEAEGKEGKEAEADPEMGSDMQELDPEPTPAPPAAQVMVRACAMPMAMPTSRTAPQRKRKAGRAKPAAALASVSRAADELTAQSATFSKASARVSASSGGFGASLLGLFKSKPSRKKEAAAPARDRVMAGAAACAMKEEMKEALSASGSDDESEEAEDDMEGLAELEAELEAELDQPANAPMMPTAASEVDDLFGFAGGAPAHAAPPAPPVQAASASGPPPPPAAAAPDVAPDAGATTLARRLMDSCAGDRWECGSVAALAPLLPASALAALKAELAAANLPELAASSTEGSVETLAAQAAGLSGGARAAFEAAWTRALWSALQKALESCDASLKALCKRVCRRVPAFVRSTQGVTA